MIYQSYAISQDSLFKANIAIHEKLSSLNGGQKLNDCDDQFPLETDETNVNEQDLTGHGRTPKHSEKSLKLQIAT